MESKGKWGVKLLMVGVMLSLSSMAEAEQRQYSTVGEYVMNDYESTEAAEVRAFDNAKQNALEQAGVLVENYTRTEDMVVAEDTLRYMTNGSLQVLDKQIEYKSIAPGMTKVIVKLESRVDTADVEKVLAQKRDELEHLTNAYNRLRLSIKNIDDDTKKLKDRMATMIDGQVMSAEIKDLKIKEKQRIAKQKYDEIFNIYNNSEDRGEIRDKVVASLKEMLNIDGKNANGYQFIGAILTGKEKYKYLNMSLEINPNGAGTYGELGKYYSEKGNYTKALENYSKGMILNPKMYELYGGRGNVYVELKEYAKAEKDYFQALSLRPDSFIVRNCLGHMYSMSRDYPKSIKWYTEVISVYKKKDKWMGYNDRGDVYNEMGEFDKALDDFNTALNHVPPEMKNYNLAKSIIYQNRGNVYYHKGDGNKAIADYERSIALNDGDYVSRCNLAAVYKRTGYYYKALDLYTEALKNADNNIWQAKIYLWRGEVNELLKQRENAKREYELAIQKDEKYADAYKFLGTVYSYEGDYDRAIKYLSKAVELDSEYWEAEYNLSIAYLKKGNGDKTIEVARSLMRKYPDNPRGYDMCGCGYELKGMYEMAINYIEKAIQIDPKSSEYCEDLERVKRKYKVGR